MIDQFILMAILLSALVTWLPRTLPFFLVRIAELPDKMLRFFTYLPISIIFALILSSIFEVEIGELPQLKLGEFLAVIPTFIVMLKTKNVMAAVIVGVLCMALLRLVSV